MTKTHIAFGTSIYPSPTRGDGKRLGKTTFRRCIQCGLLNDVNKTKFGDSQGESDATGASTTGGCRFCGSVRWLLRKPKHLIDGSKQRRRINRR